MRNLSISLCMIFTLIFSLFIWCQSQDEENKEEIISKSYYVFFQEGEKFLEEGHFFDAQESYERSMKIAYASKDRNGEVRCILRLSLVFWNLGQLDKSLALCKKALSLSDEYGLSKAYAESQGVIKIHDFYEKGKLKREIHEYDDSILSFQTAVDLARKIGSKYHELKCLRQLSLSHWEINEVQKFYILNEKCLELSKELNHKSELGKAYNHIGLFHWKNNDYSKALNFYYEALRIARELKDPSEISTCMNNIGVVFKCIGNYLKASEYLEKAIEIDEQYGNMKFLCMEFNNLGVIFEKIALNSGSTQDFLTSIKYYENSMELSKKINDLRTEIKALNNIGSVYLNLKVHKEAIQYFNLGLSKSMLINDLEASGVIINNLGYAWLNIGELKKAEDLFKKAVKIAQNNYNKEILWEAYFGLGKCFEKRQDVSQATNYYKNAIDVIDRIRKGIAIDIYKAGFARDKLKVYESLVSLLYKHKNNRTIEETNAEIFRMIESAKARAFLESLGESQVNIHGRLTPNMKKKEAEITNRISSRIRILTQMDLTESQRKKIFLDVRHAEDDYISFISKVRIEIPEIASLVAPEPCTLEEVQKKIINDKTALIEYFLGESISFVYLITKEHVYLNSLPGREIIGKSLKAYLKALSEQSRKPFIGEKAGQRLAEELLPFPLSKIPKTVENLIIVPDGILYYLPFETLFISIKKNSSQKESLLSKFKISYSPSSSSLLFLTRMKGEELPQKDLLAFGNPSYGHDENSAHSGNTISSSILKDVFQSEGFDLSPLPSSQKEIESIAKFFSSEKKDIYFGNKACEDIVKKMPLGDYKIIHFACHGFLDEKIPFRSALVLSMENCANEDGFLQVSEIYNLRIKSELVILSACQTARGRLENGEGVLGLPRIFFNAGARSVVSTLWRIDDKSTAKFMEFFYSYLNDGHSKAQSLRLAKLKMIKSGFQHPFYWAAFLLNGDYSSSVLRKGH